MRGLRDRGGVLAAVSTKCTHLGCLVRFNDAETAWECPCHGSRSTFDGSVIQRPANKPLAPQRLDTSPIDGDDTTS
jgi:Rieske Fe-S protein